MLSKINRLTRQKDFEAIYKQGKALHSGELTMRFRVNSLTFSRFGMVVSTKVDKRAVARNRLRRQLSEVIRINLDTIKSGYDIVFIFKKTLLEKDFSQISDSALGILKKAGLFSK